MINPQKEQILNHLPIAVCTCNKDGYITFYNEFAKNLWGRSPELGKEFWCGSWKIFSIDGNPLPLEECPMALTLKSGKPLSDQIIIERVNGSRKLIEIHTISLFDNNNEFSGATATYVDVSQRGTSDINDVMLAAIIESSEDAIISKTRNGVITSWNVAAENIFGYSKNEALGQHISLIVPHDLIKEEETLLSKIWNNERVKHYETRRQTKSGKIVPVSLTISPIKDSKGNIIGASKIARDISLQNQADEKQAILASIVDSSDDTILRTTMQGIVTN